MGSNRRGKNLEQVSMKMINKRYLRRCTVLLISTMAVFLIASLVLAATDQGSSLSGGNQLAPVDLNFEIVQDGYEYQLEGRQDPFMPFYSGESIVVEMEDPDAIVESKERLTGMQLFEPGQLNLVGLVELNGKYVALVEDFVGKGYVIEEGIKIGRRGTVRKIMANKVVIEEVAMTRAGKELRNEIVMALRKEGEE